MEDDPSDPWDYPSSPLPLSSLPPDTFEIDKIDIGSSVFCPPGNFYPPSRHILHFFGLFSWRNPCTPHRFWLHNADTPRYHHKQRTSKMEIDSENNDCVKVAKLFNFNLIKRGEYFSLFSQQEKVKKGQHLSKIFYLWNIYIAIVKYQSTSTDNRTWERKIDINLCDTG